MYPVDRSRFLTRWTGNSLIAWPLSVLFCVPVFAILGMLISTSDLYVLEVSSSSDVSDGIIGLAAIGCIGGAIGLAIGVLQKSTIRDFLYYDVRYWQRCSFIGGAIGFPFALFMHGFFTETAVMELAFLSTFVLSLSGIQTIALRRYINSAWLWVLGNLVGSIICATVFVRAIDTHFGFIFVAAASLGLITGVTIYWQFQHMIRIDVTFEE